MVLLALDLVTYSFDHSTRERTQEQDGKVVWSGGAGFNFLIAIMNCYEKGSGLSVLTVIRKPPFVHMSIMISHISHDNENYKGD